MINKIFLAVLASIFPSILIWMISARIMMSFNPCSEGLGCLAIVAGIVYFTLFYVGGPALIIFTFFFYKLIDKLFSSSPSMYRLTRGLLFANLLLSLILSSLFIILEGYNFLIGAHGGPTLIYEESGIFYWTLAVLFSLLYISIFGYKIFNRLYRTP